MDDVVDSLADAMGSDPTGWHPFAYGYLKRSVQQHLDGELTLDGLDGSLSLLEMALMTVRARLQAQHDAMRRPVGSGG